MPQQQQPPMVPDGVLVGYLSGGTPTLEFTKSAAAAQVHAIRAGVPLIGQWPLKSGPRIAAGRNYLSKAFLSSQAEWLLMVDDDMVIPVDAITRFLAVAHPEHAPVVAGLTFGEGRDGLFPTIWRYDHTLNEQVRVDEWPDDALLAVDGTGAACLFIHRSVLEDPKVRHPEPWPWFEETVSATGHSVGEDMTFCLRVRSAGYPIFIDTALVFGHVKSRVVDVDEYHRWVDTHRYLITGVGDASLRFAAQIMSSLSLPTGLSRSFTLDGYRPSPFGRGDASWLALPFLNHYTGYVMHMVRHPLALLDTFLDTKFFAGDPSFSAKFNDYWRFTREHASEVWGPDTELERAMAFVWSWNRRIEERAHQRLRVEDFTGADLVDMIRYAGAMHQPWEIQEAIDGARARVQIPTPVLTWGDLPDGLLKRQLQRLAEDYGYE